MTTDNTTDPKLEPCPFCGRKAVIEEFRDGDDPQPLFVATCELCPVKTYDQFSAQEAAQVWNSRATVAAPQGEDFISRQVAVGIADARLKDVPEHVDIEADRNLFAAGYLAAAGGIKAALERVAAPAPVAPSPIPEQKSDVCVKCSHLKLNPWRGYCQHETSPFGKRPVIYCGCNCEFPAATPATPVVEQENQT